MKVNLFVIFIALVFMIILIVILGLVFSANPTIVGIILYVLVFVTVIILVYMFMTGQKLDRNTTMEDALNFAIEWAEKHSHKKLYPKGRGKTEFYGNPAKMFFGFLLEDGEGRYYKVVVQTKPLDVRDFDTFAEEDASIVYEKNPFLGFSPVEQGRVTESPMDYVPDWKRREYEYGRTPYAPYQKTDIHISPEKEKQMKKEEEKRKRMWSKK